MCVHALTSCTCVCQMRTSCVGPEKGRDACGRADGTRELHATLVERVRHPAQKGLVNCCSMVAWEWHRSYTNYSLH